MNMADIELIIKMPKRIYDYICKRHYIANGDILDIKDAIIDGTPLPTLTDPEQRLFLSAMSREEKVCKNIDEDKVLDGNVRMLVPLCQNIERKVKEVLF
jgi:hypothetical protein